MEKKRWRQKCDEQNFTKLRRHWNYLNWNSMRDFCLVFVLIISHWRFHYDVIYFSRGRMSFHIHDTQSDGKTNFDPLSIDLNTSLNQSVVLSTRMNQINTFSLVLMNFKRFHAEWKQQILRWVALRFKTIGRNKINKLCKNYLIINMQRIKRFEEIIWQRIERKAAKQPKLTFRDTTHTHKQTRQIKK